MPVQRRTLFQLAPVAFLQSLEAQSATPAPTLAATFPTQPPELAREMVGVSHGNINRVRELVTTHPTLAKASWDWGFGDWETALGAASHTGNREIAELLIDKGAPPTLFSATMLGHLDVVKAWIAATPGAQRVAGPHSISLLAHAKVGGDKSVAVHRYLESLGDAGEPALPSLTEAESAALAGIYVFGDSPKERIDITIVRGQIRFTLAGKAAIRLFHLGNLTFHPAGAGAVRIAFTSKGLLTVSDPDLILTAQRASIVNGPVPGK